MVKVIVEMQKNQTPTRPDRPPVNTVNLGKAAMTGNGMTKVPQKSNQQICAEILKDPRWAVYGATSPQITLKKCSAMSGDALPVILVSYCKPAQANIYYMPLPYLTWDHVCVGGSEKQ